MKKIIYILVPVVIIALVSAGVWLDINKKEISPAISNKEVVVNESDISNQIRVSTPLPNQVISSPLIIEGETRGSWFFEASFPVVLTNWDGLIIAQGVATAKSDWMTTDFVPFTATLTFKNPTYKNNGFLILKRDNPSGLPQNDNALEIPIIFKNIDKPATVPPVTILPYDSGVSGRVLLGPTCPVMRNPPDLSCADRSYQTTVQIISIGSPKSSPFATVETDKDGKYKIMLPPGNYAVQPVGGKPLPRCNTENVTVEPGIVSIINISCDTGIR